MNEKIEKARDFFETSKLNILDYILDDALDLARNGKCFLEKHENINKNISTSDIRHMYYMATTFISEYEKNIATWEKIKEQEKLLDFIEGRE